MAGGAADEHRPGRRDAAAAASSGSRSWRPLDLTGATVREVVPRGKHLLIRLADGRTLRTHFRMDGSWHIYRPGTKWHGGPAYDVRLVLATPDWECVGYRLHDIDLIPTAEEDRLVGHLGPDVLGPDWDLDEALRRLRSEPRRADRRRAGRPAQPGRDRQPLQGRVAVHPRHPPVDAGRRRPATWPALVERARTLMRANLHHPEQNTTGDPRRGRDHWVFGRRGKPCLRCGTAILLGEQGPHLQERVTWWCPRCQAARSPIDPQARTGEPDHPQPVTLYR